LLISRGARLVKLLTTYSVVEYCYCFRKAVSRFDLTGDCQQTRVELCACTSDRERSTRAGEAYTSDRQAVNANPDWDWDSCLCERSLSTCEQNAPTDPITFENDANVRSVLYRRLIIGKIYILHSTNICTI